VRKSSSVRLGILLAVAAVLLACEREKPPERRCVDVDGRFVDEGLCAGAGADGAAADGGTASATGGWDEPDGGPGPQRSGFHFVWIPYGAFGGLGTQAPGYVRSGPGGGPGAGPSSPGAVTRGGFGSTGAAHAGPSSSAGS
jgi:hypothetical protein